MSSTEVLLIFANGTGYDVAVDVEFVLPSIYLFSFFLAVFLRRFLPKSLAVIMALFYVVSLSVLLYSLYADEVWRFIMPAAVIVGVFMGLSSWLRHVLARIKALGDDDSWVS